MPLKKHTVVDLGSGVTKSTIIDQQVIYIRGASNSINVPLMTATEPCRVIIEVRCFNTPSTSNGFYLTCVPAEGLSNIYYQFIDLTCTTQGDLNPVSTNSISSNNHYWATFRDQPLYTGVRGQVVMPSLLMHTGATLSYFINSNFTTYHTLSLGLYVLKPEAFSYGDVR